MSGSFYEQEPLDPGQLQELQDALNALADDPAWKHKIIVLPPSGPPPSVVLKCSGSSYGDVGMLLECPCGWEREVSAGWPNLEVNLAELRDLARHTCLESEEEK